MRDMKANFALANPSLTQLKWSFMLDIFRETLVGNSVVVGDGEEGEVVRGVWVAEENMAVVEELEATTELRVTEQTNSRADPPSESERLSPSLFFSFPFWAQGYPDCTPFFFINEIILISHIFCFLII